MTVRRGKRPSDGIDAQPSIRHLGDASDVPRVRGHDAVVAPNRSFDDGDIDHIVVGGPTGKHTDATGEFLAHWLDQAHRQKARQARLAGPTAPGLRQDGGWHDRSYLLGKESRMQRPHTTVIA